MQFVVRNLGEKYDNARRLVSVMNVVYHALEICLFEDAIDHLNSLPSIEQLDDSSLSLWNRILENTCQFLSGHRKIVAKHLCHLLKNFKNIHYVHPTYGSLLISIVNMPQCCCFNQFIPMIIKEGVDPNKADVFYKTPIFHAAQRKNYFALEFLIRHGADVNHKDNKGDNILHAITEYGYITEGNFEDFHATTKIIDFILKHGVEINSFGNTNYTAMMLAAKNMNNLLLSYFLQCDVDVNLQCSLKATEPLSSVLHLYIHNTQHKNWDAAMMHCILEKNCNPDICDFYGRTPMVIAIRKYNIKAVHLLILANACIDISYYFNGIERTILLDVISLKDLAILELFITCGYPLKNISRMVYHLDDVHKWYATHGNNFRVIDTLNDMDPSLRQYEIAFVNMSIEEHAQLIHFLNSPLSLLKIVRIFIRQYLPKGISEIAAAVSSFTLPLALKQYIQFNELTN